VQVDSFALVGTLVSSEGPLAFFDGSESAFRQVLKPGEMIAGYRIDEILPGGVRLAEGTNRTDPCVGNGLRREDGGGWRLALGANSFASGGDSASSGIDSRDGGRSRSRGSSYDPRTAPSGPDDAETAPPSSTEANEVLKRLMEQREKEMQ